MTSSEIHVENYVPLKIHNARKKSCIAGRREIYLKLMFTTADFKLFYNKKQVENSGSLLVVHRFVLSVRKNTAAIL